MANAPPAGFTIEQQRRWAWAKYYAAEEENTELKNRIKQMTRKLHVAYQSDGDAAVAALIWQNADIHSDTLTQKHYTQFVCGSKTHKGTAKRMNKDGEEVVYDAHITAEGETYKPWKEGDEPCFYMKDYPMTETYFTLHEGSFVLKMDILTAMKGAHRRSALAQMTGFALSYGLIPEDHSYIYWEGALECRKDAEKA
jgi:hypothetical protein